MLTGNISLREDLLGKATMLRMIPTVSSIVGRVLELVSDTDSSFDDLNDVIKYDQSITAKIIGISNSAYYCRGIPIYTLKRAMLVIGFEETKRIVMCLLFMNEMLKGLKLKERDFVDLWKHSAHVACAARTLSKKMLVDDPQKVFTVALLHDIGKTVLYINVDDYHAMLKRATEKAKDLVAMEKELYGIDHQEIGYAIGVKWHFPEEFLYAIRYHHAEGPDRYNNLLKLVRAADNFVLSTNKDLGPEGFILLNEKETIIAEMQKIVDFLQVE